MNALKQGFSWWCFQGRGLDTAELLAGAAKIGYEYVDLVEEELWPRVQDHGLKIGAVSGHRSIEAGLNDPGNAARIEDELLTNLEKAVQWKVPVLICFSGNRRTDEGASLDQCAETLSRVAPAAENAGVVLAMELLNSKVDHQGYECDSTRWGRMLCERLNSPAVKLLYDIYHMQIMEGDLIRTIEENHAFFGHYHTAGNPGRGQPDDSQEIFYPAIYRAIARTGSACIVAHEFLPKGNPLDAIEAAYLGCVKSFQTGA